MFLVKKERILCMSKLKILFMGTSSFALPALQLLHSENHHIVGVITQPDRPQGRGQKTNSPPVKILALQLGLPVFQPEHIKDQTSLELIKKLGPEIIVVAAFGQILPKSILDVPALGCLNIHPSLLPKYRGAAPINWALINGESKTGVTIMMMDEEMDSGNILAQKETLISQTENFGQLHDRLASQGSSLLVQTIEQITTDNVKSKKQDSSAATFAPRLTKEMGKINWCNNVSTICNLIRGLSPSPGAYSFLDGKMLKIYAAEPKPEKTDKKPGTIVEQSNKTISVVAIDGCIILREIQLAGKKKMPAEEFLRGYKINPETILGN